MAKGKLKVKNSEMAALTLAAELCEVSLLDGREIGDTSIIEVSYKQPSNLFEMGRAIDKIEVAKK